MMIAQVPTLKLNGPNMPSNSPPGSVLPSIKEIPSQEPSFTSEMKPKIEKDQTNTSQYPTKNKTDNDVNTYSQFKNRPSPIITASFDNPSKDNSMINSKSAESFSANNSKSNSAKPVSSKTPSASTKFHNLDEADSPIKPPGN